MTAWRMEVTLLALTAALTLVTGQTLVYLDETQGRESVGSGSSLTLICALNTSILQRYRVNFSFSSFTDSNRKSLSDELFVRRTGERDMKDNVLNYTLWNVTEANSGRYFCTVTGEIPSFYIYKSSWTEIHVVKSKEHTTPPSPPVVTVTEPPPDGVQWQWLLLGACAVIMTVLLLVCVLLRRRCRRHREADPIYANTRPVANQQPSPRPAVPEENLKKVSSSQNLRNPNPHRPRHGERKQRHRQGQGV